MDLMDLDEKQILFRSPLNEISKKERNRLAQVFFCISFTTVVGFHFLTLIAVTLQYTVRYT